MVLLWQARDLNPESPAIQRDLAYAYLARGWVELARDAIRPVRSILGDDARTLYVSGVLAWWDGDTETARQELRRAVDLDPSLDGAASALSRLPE
jgi:Flp pilus assembly protein TadD